MRPFLPVDSQNGASMSSSGDCAVKSFPGLKYNVERRQMLSHPSWRKNVTDKYDSSMGVNEFNIKNNVEQ